MNRLGGDVQELPQGFGEHLGGFAAQRNTVGFRGAGREIGGVQNRVNFLSRGEEIQGSGLWALGSKLDPEPSNICTIQRSLGHHNSPLGL